ncbi:MAG: multidrug transporter, partial [Chthoniobacterales bacterium]
MTTDVPPSNPVQRLLGLLFSLLVIVLAILLALAVNRSAKINPRTDDAQVRANVIGIAPQVPGTIV